MLEEWLTDWAQRWDRPDALHVELRPHTAGSDVLELRVVDGEGAVMADVVFASIQDRRGRHILSIRDQTTEPSVRRRRLMTLVQLFLIHRYRAESVHYLTPTADNEAQTARMRELGIFSAVTTEVGRIIVADVDRGRIDALAASDRVELHDLLGLPAPAMTPA
jgi:isocitrate lyase